MPWCLESIRHLASQVYRGHFRPYFNFENNFELFGLKPKDHDISFEELFEHFDLSFFENYEIDIFKLKIIITHYTLAGWKTPSTDSCIILNVSDFKAPTLHEVEKRLVTHCDSLTSSLDGDYFIRSVKFETLETLRLKLSYH